MQPDAGRGHEVPLDLLGLALAQQAVVDEDAGQLVADRALDQGGGDRRVDAAGQPADRPLVADLAADRLRPAPRRCCPWSSLAAAGDVVQEALEHQLAVLGVQHLRVPLHAGEAAGRRSSNAATAAPCAARPAR